MATETTTDAQFAAQFSALLAAEWWAERIFINGPQDQRITRRDGTDPETRQVEAMTNGLAILAAHGRPTPSREARAKFVQHLAAAIEAAPKPLSLSVDYNPCPTLRAAGDACGWRLSMLDWPFKSNMHVLGDGRVRAAHGYGEPWVWL